MTWTQEAARLNKSITPIKTRGEQWDENTNLKKRNYSKI